LVPLAGIGAVEGGLRADLEEEARRVLGLSAFRGGRAAL